MPKYTIQVEDGRKITLESPDEATALADADSWASSNPAQKAPVKKAEYSLEGIGRDFKRPFDDARKSMDRARGLEENSYSALRRGNLKDYAVGFGEAQILQGLASVEGVSAPLNGAINALARPWTDLGSDVAYNAGLRADEDVATNRETINRGVGLVGSVAAMMAGGLPKAPPKVPVGFRGTSLASRVRAAPETRTMRATPAQKAALKARKMVAADIARAEKAGIDINAVPPIAQTAAESLGQGARTRLEAAANLSPQVATSLQGTLSERVSQTPNLALRGFERKLGFSPEEARGGYKEVMKSAQKEAAPLYEQFVRGNDTPQMSPKLARMMRDNPYIKSARAKAERQLMGQDRPAYLETEQISLPDSLPTGTGRTSADYLADIRELTQGGAQRATRADGPNLNEFVASRGGIKDVGGDLRSMGAGEKTLNKGMGKLGKLVRVDGRSLDDMAVSAWEAGYFREVPSQRELLDAIDQGLSGTPVRSMQNGMNGADRAEYLSQLEQRVGTLDLPPNASAKQIASALAGEDAQAAALEALAETGGVYPGSIGQMESVRAPRLELMDMIKRNLDDMENQAITGEATNDAIAVESTRKSFVRALDDINPEYAKTRAAGGEAPRMKAAYDRAKSWFFDSSRTNSEFQEWAAGLSAPEARAAMSKIADDFATMTGGQGRGSVDGNLNLNKYKTDNFRNRLILVADRAKPGSGEAQARAFTQYMSDLDKSRASAMDMMPRGNSKTSRLTEGGNQIRDELGEVDVDKLAKMIRNPKTGLLEAALQPVVSFTGRQINRARLGGASSEDVIAEYARLLTQDLRVTLKELQSASPAAREAIADVAQANGGRIPPAAKLIARDVVRGRRSVKDLAPFLSVNNMGQGGTLPAYAGQAAAQEGQE